MKIEKRVISSLCAAALMIGSFAPASLAESAAKWVEEKTKDGWVKITQEGGKTLGYSPDSGVSILTVDGYAFKDLDRDGELDAYEDWRLDAQTRAQLQENLLKTWEQERKTCFFITHDVEEAVLLATKIIIMSAGPGHITEIVPVTLPYPRTQQTKLTPEFNELKNQIWNKVYREYLEHTK